MQNKICPICQSDLSSGYHVWHLLCKNCGYEKAILEPTINLHSSHQLIDEDARKNGLQELRISNFHKLLRDIKSLKPNGGRLLDVGCAHGWFLEVAKNDFEVLGIEPDQKVFHATLSYGLPVRMGYFPEILEESEKFDIIVFNDVFEHIKDIDKILVSCHQHLNEDALLVLNLPSSKGLFYKVSKILCKFNFCSFFERLWQKDLPSPHLHYFNLLNLSSLLNHNGFELKIYGDLPTLHLKGLYTRISYTGSYSTVACTVIYIMVALSLPILRILPSDIIYIVSKRQ